MHTSLKKTLKQTFGFDSFRPMQEEIINTLVSGNDCLVLMPTGGGKSLCYQLPAIAMPGTAIIISPLISLMRDQVVGLKEQGVHAEFLNSSLTIEAQQEIKQRAQQGELDLLYVSPEKVTSIEFQYLLENIHINLIAIDEAHCISSWGHDFRPEYTRLGHLKARFPHVPFCALTATADKLTREDIVSQLELDNPSVFSSSFDRPNLSLTVKPGRNRFSHISEFVKARKNEHGIIYCLSKKSTEDVAKKLRGIGIQAEHYHAGMTPDQRNKRQDAFIFGKIDVMCATIAFGMGIDKSNVRFVIHYNLPKNMEGYYQEIGRAGRDGLPADTLLFYSFSDVVKLRRFINDGTKQHVQHAKLDRMQQYADSVICRRKILLNYFNEAKLDNCNNCDVCHNPPEMFDGTVVAQKALSAIARTGQTAALGMLIDILRGSKNQDVLKRGYDSLSTFGIGKEYSSEQWEQLMLQLLHQGLIDIAYHRGHALTITEAGKEILTGNGTIQLVDPITVEKVQQERHAASKKEKKADRGELFERLRMLRYDLAKDAGIPPYLVFSDATLAEMAAEKPENPTEFLAITGVGEKKRATYGATFLQAIRDFLEKGSEGNTVFTDTYEMTYELFSQGESPEDIAQKRQKNIDTIYGHLAKLYADGKDIDLLSFVGSDFEKIRDVLFSPKPPKSLKSLFDYFEGEIPYYKLKLSKVLVEVGTDRALRAKK
ncbi:MAG: DNA helicase RecQ [Candidatus Magasanikbacteria bacterium]|jgi:ATP-dependent DNA helicase RecQ|nr:DNA helicase RecQ [Candidatus Magasanikbacteria bacterium]